jgi:type IV pilus assembly protein PilY1
MNHISTTIVAALFSAGFISQGLAKEIVLEDFPVNYGIRAKPNILMVVDDSGSMDVELSVTGTLEGYGYWDGSFVNGNAPRVSGGDRYTQLFPLGNGSANRSTSTNPYNGGRKFGDEYLPPFDAYGFMRSSDWNNAYYDPALTYEPWPSYGTFAWPDIDPAQAWLDPGLIGSAQTDRALDLYNIVPAEKFGTGGNARFDGQDGMWCDNQGTLCNADGTNISIPYWAATYFVKDDSSLFTIDESLSAASTIVDVADAIILEAEAAQLNTSTIDTVVGSGAGNSEYINFADATGYLGAPPSNGSVFKFTTSAPTVEIWVRRLMPNGLQDSLWMSLDGHSATAIAPEDDNSWSIVGSQAWHMWRDGHEIPGLANNFLWEKWSDVTLNGDGTYTLRINQRETDVGLDQVAIVVGSSPSFASSGPLTNTAVSTTAKQYSCSDPSTLPANLYTQFHENRVWFAGLDSVAPDNTCLERVEIRSSRTTYPSGRSFDEELQNFANWFTYYRKRHQVARGAIGSAVQGISGVRTGLFWLNNRRTIDMYDFDVPSDVSDFLDENYYYVSGGNTPNRSALNHAGNQLNNNSSIIEYACQRNYTLLFTDGYTSAGDSVGSLSSTNVDGSEGEPFADKTTNTLADVAMYYYNRRLRSGAFDAGEVPVPNACTDGIADPWLDCNADLHMNTYSVSLGLSGRDVLGQSFTVDGVSREYAKVRDAHDAPPSWPAGSIGFNGTAIDDLYHAAVNGRGEMYYAQRPQELKEELQQALRNILASEGSAAGLTFNSATLNADSLVFNTIFNTTSWTGDLIATQLDPLTGQPNGSIAWNAQAELDSQNWEDRFIVTYNPDTEESVVFDWANLSAGQQSDLNTSPAGTTDSFGEQRLNFLKGDTSQESTLFRTRTSVLGDIVSSTPAYVAGATLSWPDYDLDNRFGASLNSHSTFRDSVKDRTPMIYVGANDGMLHGFDASNGTGGGQERFAYVPAAIYSSGVGEGLHYLTDPDYTHRFYVDAEPAFSDVFVGRDGGSADWMTILSGGFRTGAKGFYALDITNPAQFNDANADDRVLLEYTGMIDTDGDGTVDPDPYLGYIFERPTIGMMANGEWAMIYGNGFNSIYKEGAVYVVFIERVLKDGWIEGDTFLRFTTEALGAINGITAIDYGTDKVIDAVYASDAGGYVWKLEFSDPDEANWDFAYRSGDPVPLFEAKNDAGEAQPIITRPRVIKHTSIDDSTGNEPNRMVIFGTGSMVDTSDLNSEEVQSFYVVWDDDSVNNSPLIRTDLAESNVTNSLNPEGYPVRDITASQSPWTGGRNGFHFDLPVTGERVLDYIDIREAREAPGSYYAIFSSVVPDSDVCSYGGTSWIMAVDLESGRAPTYAVFDANQDGVVDSDDAGIGGIYSSDYLVDFVAVGGTGYGNTSTGDITTFTIEEGGQVFAGRMGWQELIAR